MVGLDPEFPVECYIAERAFDVCLDWIFIMYRDRVGEEHFVESEQDDETFLVFGQLSIHISWSGFYAYIVQFSENTGVSGF